MDINEFKNRKNQMEAEIRGAIQKAMADFRTDTGYSPSSISIYLIDATTIGEEKKHFEVTEVTSEVEI